jgi:predicted dehydrogenase
MRGKKVNVAVIGCGHWGPNHIRVFNSLSVSSVVAVADTDTNRLNYIKEQYPSAACEMDYQKVLQNDSVEAVVVATPAATHFEIVKNALIAGKHVLCEKPLCTSSDETAALDKLASEKKLILAVGYLFIFNSGILALKELISNKELGILHYFNVARSNLGPIRSDVNVVYDLTSHDLSILNFLLNGTPQNIVAVGGCYLQQGIQDIAFISLIYQTSLIANIFTSWLDPRKTRQITVVGDKKMALWDDLNTTGSITIFDKSVIKEPYYKDYEQFLKLRTIDKNIIIPKVMHTEPLKVQNEAFILNIIDNTQPVNNAKFDLDVIKVIECINQKMVTNN